MPAHNRIPPSLPADHTPASTAPERPFGGGHLSGIERDASATTSGRGARRARPEERTVMKDELTFLELIALIASLALIAALTIAGT